MKKRAPITVGHSPISAKAVHCEPIPPAVPARVAGPAGSPDKPLVPCRGGDAFEFIELLRSVVTQTAQGP